MKKEKIKKALLFLLFLIMNIVIINCSKGDSNPGTPGQSNESGTQTSSADSLESNANQNEGNVDANKIDETLTPDDKQKIESSLNEILSGIKERNEILSKLVNPSDVTEDIKNKLQLISAKEQKFEKQTKTLKKSAQIECIKRLMQSPEYNESQEILTRIISNDTGIREKLLDYVTHILY